MIFLHLKQYVFRSLLSGLIVFAIILLPFIYCFFNFFLFYFLFLYSNCVWVRAPIFLFVFSVGCYFCDRNMGALCTLSGVWFDGFSSNFNSNFFFGFFGRLMSREMVSAGDAYSAIPGPTNLI